MDYHECVVKLDIDIDTDIDIIYLSLIYQGRRTRGVNSKKLIQR